MRTTARAPIVFAIASIALAAAACAPIGSGTETERERCMAWASTLILPSRADTPETAIALNEAIAIFRAACPGIDPGV